MIPYFGMEINSGLQASDAAKARNISQLSNIGDAIFAANQAYKQRKYNSELEEMQAKRAEIIGAVGPDEYDRQIRGLETMGHVRGVRTALTPQDYLHSEQHKADMEQRKEQNEAELKQRQAEMEFKLQEEEKNGILQAYNQAMGQRRILTDQKAQLIGTGVATPEATKALGDLQKEIDMYMGKAEKLKKYGETLGIRPEHWYDFTGADSNTGGGTTSPFSDIQGKEADLADEFMQTQTGTPDEIALRRFLISKNLNLTDASIKNILGLANNRDAARGSDTQKEYEAKKRAFEKAKQEFELLELRRKDKISQQDSERKANEQKAKEEFLARPDVDIPTKANKIALGVYERDYGEDVKFKSSNLGQEFVKRLFNGDLSDIEYKEHLAKMRGGSRKPEKKSTGIDFGGAFK